MDEAVKSITHVLYLLTLKSRFHALSLLGATSFPSKLADAKLAFDAIFLASILEDYLKRTYHFSARTLTWKGQLDTVADCFIDEKTINQSKLDQFINSIESDLSMHLQTLKDIHPNHLMYASVHFIAKMIDQQIGSYKPIGNDLIFPDVYWGSDEPKKTLKTPDIIRLDDQFEATTSVLEKDQVKFSKVSFEENVEFFWNLGIREILAAEICAMSIFEYDNLPLDFYHDMVKQMYDESRHANFYIKKSVEFFPIAKKRSSDERLLAIISNFEQGGKLPVPKEKNFIEAFLNASLTERLILLNIRTEAPAVARLKDKMDSPFCDEFPDIKESFSIDRNDEISHGSIGYKWLRHLYPELETRKKILQDVDSYRGLLLATSIDANSEDEFLELLERLAE
ncbi:MAG: hypothetical protein COA38_12650 [Fluviicola sp.]|nr:MAG: hypothetical protein COA38_12650 [Fluviicola sp.]